MKRVYIITIVCSLLLCTCAYGEFINPTRSLDAMDYDPNEPGNLLPEHIVALSFVLMDTDTGEVLMEREADMRFEPVTIAPIVNALTALRLDGDWEDAIHVTEEIARLDEDLVVTPFKPGEIITLRDAIYAMIMQSSADAAVCVGEAYAPPVDYQRTEYVVEMNETVRQIGCTDTRFTSVLGFRAGNQYTTARDQARVLLAAMDDVLLRSALSSPEYRLHATNLHPARTIVNANQLLDKTSEHYNPTVMGGRVSFTEETGYSLIAMAEKDGHKLVTTLVYSGQYGRWADATWLLNYGFDVLENRDGK